MGFTRDQPRNGKKQMICIDSLQLINGANHYKSPPAQHGAFAVPLHPLEIKPAGNAYTAVENIKSAAGLFSTLADELIIHMLEFLPDRSLLQLRATCKTLYAFCSFDDLWKNLCIEYVSVWPLPWRS